MLRFSYGLTSATTFRSFVSASVALICATLSGRATAATIDTTQLADGSTVISVQGDLVLPDIEVFKLKLSGVTKGLVLLASDGGSLQAGIQIGTAIRLRGLATLVPDGSRCASACAIAWLGGTPRVMGQNARIGFHAAYRLERGAPVATGVGNALLGAYLNRLGLSDRAIIYVTMAAPSSMTWLSRDEAEALGIDVKHVALGVSDDRQPRSVTQPAVTNPAEPRIGISPVSRARRFAENYLEQLGTVAGETASFFENHYAANVLYYSKKVARPQIIAEKVKFGARWPKRSYQWRPADLNVSCADQGRTCTIEGLLAMTRSRNPHPA